MLTLTSRHVPRCLKGNFRRIPSLVSTVFVIVFSLGLFVACHWYGSAAASSQGSATRSASPYFHARVADPTSAKDDLIRLSRDVTDEFVLHKVAIALAGVSEFSASQEVLQRTKDLLWRRQTVERIAELLKSLAIARQNPDLVDNLGGYLRFAPEASTPLGTAYAVAKAYAGKVDQAKGSLNGISDMPAKGRSYLAAAQAAKKGGHPDHARALIEEASQTVDLKDRFAETRGLIALMEDGMKLGLASDIDVLLRRAVLAWKGSNENFYGKLQQLTPVVKLAAQSGHHGIAKQIVMDLSQERSRFITIEGRNDFSLSELALASGDYNLIDAVLKEAEAQLTRASTQQQSIPAIEQVAQSAVQFLESGKAKALLSRGRRLAERITDVGYRTRSLIAVQQAAVKLALERHDTAFLDIAVESVWESELGYLDPIIFAAAKLGDRKRTAALYTRIQKGNPIHTAFVARQLAEETNDPSYLRDAWQVKPGTGGVGWTETKALIDSTKKVAISAKDASLLELARHGSAAITVPVSRAAVLSDLIDVGLKLDAVSFVHGVADDLIVLADGMEGPTQQIPVYAAALSGLSRSGREQAAKELLAHAEQTVSSLRDVRQRAYLWGELGRHAKQGGLAADAARLFSKAKDSLPQVADSDRTQLADWLERSMIQEGRQAPFDGNRAGTGLPGDSSAGREIGSIEKIDKLIVAATREHQPESLRTARNLAGQLPITTRSAQLTRIINEAIALARATEDQRFLAEARETVELIPKLDESSPAMREVVEVIRKFEKISKGTEAAPGIQDPFGRQSAIELFVETAARLDDWGQVSVVLQLTESRDDFSGALAAAVRGWVERSLVTVGSR